MKRIFLTLVLMVAFIATYAQITTLTFANQSKGVDSIEDAEVNYFYLNGVSGTQNSCVHAYGSKALAPIKNSEIIAICFGETTAPVTNTDSTYFLLQVSLDNTNWFTWKEGPDAYVVSGGTYKYTGLTATTAAHAHTNAQAVYCLVIPAANTGAWPYMRLKTTAPGGHVYVKAYAILKQL